MSARKNRPPKRLPAIVPRFLKNAVTIGAIPALVGCDKGRPDQHVQPVVAHYVDKSPPVVAAYAPDASVVEVAPVVAAMLPAVVAAMVQPNPPPRPIVRDAGIDAAKPRKKPTAVKAPPPPVVAALVGPQPDLGNLPPAVVAAMLPDQNLVTPKPPPIKPKKR